MAVSLNGRPVAMTRLDPGSGSLDSSAIVMVASDDCSWMAYLARRSTAARRSSMSLAV
jgi:hypothetical protein